MPMLLRRKKHPSNSPLSTIILRTLVRRIDAFVFPPLCIVCDAPRPDDDRWLCRRCFDETTAAIVNRTACPRCGQNRETKTCACDIVWDYPFTRITSFIDYNDTVQTIMRHIKYRGKRNLARYMGSLCATHIDKSIIGGIDIVIPVPLHRLRLRKRGYNQAEWFARGLFADTAPGKIAANLLRRTRPTKTQTALDKSYRRGNVAGAFSLAARAAETLHGQRVLLVDDVITTGATVTAAAATLLSGGCADVTVLSLARD
jgi:ComF family protein